MKGCMQSVVPLGPTSCAPLSFCAVVSRLRRGACLLICSARAFTLPPLAKLTPGLALGCSGRGQTALTQELTPQAGQGQRDGCRCREGGQKPSAASWSLRAKEGPLCLPGEGGTSPRKPEFMGSGELVGLFQAFQESALGMDTGREPGGGGEAPSLI